MHRYLILALVFLGFSLGSLLAQISDKPADETPPTRALPTLTDTDRILSVDRLTYPQNPLVCYNAAGDVVMIFDSESGQFRFDFSTGLVQTGKCRS